MNRTRQDSLGGRRLGARTRSPTPSARKASTSTGIPFSKYPSLSMTAAVEEIHDPAPRTRQSSSSHVLLPAIYANTGVHTPPALLDARGQSVQVTPQGEGGDPFADLTPIVEGQVAHQVPIEAEHEKPAAGFQWSALPLFLIFQYFVLALHTTSHDQVFLMYLTS